MEVPQGSSGLLMTIGTMQDEDDGEDGSTPPQHSTAGWKSRTMVFQSTMDRVSENAVPQTVLFGLRLK